MATQVPDGNVAARLRVVAALMPGAVAIAQPDGPPVPNQDRAYALTTFGCLDESSEAIARGLNAWGLKPGMRVAMLVPFGASFIELTFALLKAGVVVVLVDPGMGRNHLVRCLSEAQPDGFIGIPKAQAIRTVLRSKFPNAKWNVTVGRRWFWGGKTLAQIKAMGNAVKGPDPLPRIERSDPAAVIFTTGSTGPPKGVQYTHGTFHAQIDRIRERYDIHRGSRDLACFPLFGLFDAVMGVTTIIPDMDPTRPAQVDPQRLVEAATQWEVDQAFGSPALWNTVVRWAEANGHGRVFPTLKRVLSAGAPVPAATLEKLRGLIDPDAMVVTPYGATEALPIASIESREIIAETGPASAKGKGVCVGTRFEGAEWRVIQIEDGPISDVSQTVEMPLGKIGELMVSGPMVTTQYVVRQDQNALHKVADGDRIWHRMGDVGYLDGRDRFWFCGRKAHRVTMEKRTLFTIQCEAIFNAHPRVYRSALVGRGQRPHQTPVVFVELFADAQPKNDADRNELLSELKELAARNPLTRRIEEVVIRQEPLPVDIRHNSKIFRERLADELN
ncbi:Long-chain-fatty-acid--CoA ligase [Rubripirellula lacrimiformis]|uniref:Long-chain-fatty-acid--CoA ligase n=1 Tax=Rubripirellula lacrimiformis TaxID=1930273 RepID=A0A517NB84_9BACT|nr:fatty acid CoA ligase family protein [Rubripirellula lacrimiformis]QDT04395.1 Long-chain-fatty-acid--CoA ligase [Rubripirellula lacrimiformis]